MFSFVYLQITESSEFLSVTGES